MGIKTKICAGILALCMAIPASAGGYYSSNEDGYVQPPANGSISITTEDVPLDKSNSTVTVDGEEIDVDLDSLFDGIFSLFGGTDALTPLGNITLIDDILQDETNHVESVENEQKSKQFITVQTKSGNYFYIIIDRSGEQENVYFLNMVDENDLFALLEETTAEETKAPETEPEPVCSCTEKCAVGEVNTKCEVCKLTMKSCVGKEAELMETPEEPEKSAEPTKTTNKNLPLVILLLAGGGGLAVYLLKFRKEKTETAGDTDLDEYDFGEDEESEDMENE